VRFIRSPSAPFHLMHGSPVDILDQPGGGTFAQSRRFCLRGTDPKGVATGAWRDWGIILGVRFLGEESPLDRRRGVWRLGRRGGLGIPFLPTETGAPLSMSSALSSSLVASVQSGRLDGRVVARASLIFRRAVP